MTKTQWIGGAYPAPKVEKVAIEEPEIKVVRVTTTHRATRQFEESIVAYVTSHPECESFDVAQHTGRHIDAVRGALNRLMLQSVLSRSKEPKGTGYSYHYSVGSVKHPPVKTLRDKLHEYIAANGGVKHSYLNAKFGKQSTPAKLRELVQRGMIYANGDAGGIKYYAGSAQ